MGKRIFALRGRIYRCALPALLLFAAAYLFATASASVSTGEKMLSYSLFDMIASLLGG